jgi:hypothetical protein
MSGRPAQRCASCAKCTKQALKSRSSAALRGDVTGTGSGAMVVGRRRRGRGMTGLSQPRLLLDVLKEVHRRAKAGRSLSLEIVEHAGGPAQTIVLNQLGPGDPGLVPVLGRRVRKVSLQRTEERGGLGVQREGLFTRPSSLARARLLINYRIFNTIWGMYRSPQSGIGDPPKWGSGDPPSKGIYTSPLLRRLFAGFAATCAQCACSWSTHTCVFQLLCFSPAAGRHRRMRPRRRS